MYSYSVFIFIFNNNIKYLERGALLSPQKSNHSHTSLVSLLMSSYYLNPSTNLLSLLCTVGSVPGNPVLGICVHNKFLFKMHHYKYLLRKCSAGYSNPHWVILDTFWRALNYQQCQALPLTMLPEFSTLGTQSLSYHSSRPIPSKPITLEQVKQIQWRANTK